LIFGFRWLLKLLLRVTQPLAIEEAVVEDEIEGVLPWTLEDLAMFDAQWKAFALRKEWLDLPSEERRIETPEGVFNPRLRYPKGSWGGEGVGYTQPPTDGRLGRRVSGKIFPEIITYAEFRTRYRDLDVVALLQGRIDQRRLHSDLTDAFYELEEPQR
jgi:hypothetical protein